MNIIKVMMNDGSIIAVEREQGDETSIDVISTLLAAIGATNVVVEIEEDGEKKKVAVKQYDTDGRERLSE